MMMSLSKTLKLSKSISVQRQMSIPKEVQPTGGLPKYGYMFIKGDSLYISLEKVDDSKRIKFVTVNKKWHRINLPNGFAKDADYVTLTLHEGYYEVRAHVC